MWTDWQSVLRQSFTTTGDQQIVQYGIPDPPACAVGVFPLSCVVVGVLLGALGNHGAAEEIDVSGTVRCANLIYANGKTSVCFSSEFLKQLSRESHIKADTRLYPVRLESAELYDYPFAIMTGEGGFQLTPAQRQSFRKYLTQGGFIIASAGCSNPSWAKGFRRELAEMFPDLSLQPLDVSHPIFHCLYEIPRLDLGKSSGQARLEGLEIDGKIVLVFSSDGLNDSGKVSDDCCCCGGNEIKNARLVNCNLLAYTLTH